VIEAEATGVIRASREAIWRHLTRVNEWYRWYPGLHGTTATEPIAREGQTWRSTGQMGRMLFRGEQRITHYRLLNEIHITGRRSPWLKQVTTIISLQPSGPNGEFSIRFRAEPGFWLIGRALLGWTLRNRLQSEADSVVERLSSFVENTMPYH
jgi:uncharacterized protein YndB with AHSA1/START domain